MKSRSPIEFNFFVSFGWKWRGNHSISEGGGDIECREGGRATEVPCATYDDHIAFFYLLASLAIFLIHIFPLLFVCFSWRGPDFTVIRKLKNMLNDSVLLHKMCSLQCIDRSRLGHHHKAIRLWSDHFSWALARWQNFNFNAMELINAAGCVWHSEIGLRLCQLRFNCMGIFHRMHSTNWILPPPSHHTFPIRSDICVSHFPQIHSKNPIKINLMTTNKYLYLFMSTVYVSHTTRTAI